MNHKHAVVTDGDRVAGHGDDAGDTGRDAVNGCRGRLLQLANLVVDAPACEDVAAVTVNAERDAQRCIECRHLVIKAGSRYAAELVADLAINQNLGFLPGCVVADSVCHCFDSSHAIAATSCGHCSR